MLLLFVLCVVVATTRLPLHQTYTKRMRLFEAYLYNHKHIICRRDRQMVLRWLSKHKNTHFISRVQFWGISLFNITYTRTKSTIKIRFLDPHGQYRTTTTTTSLMLGYMLRFGWKCKTSTSDAIETMLMVMIDNLNFPMTRNTICDLFRCVWVMCLFVIQRLVVRL